MSSRSDLFFTFALGAAAGALLIAIGHAQATRGLLVARKRSNGRKKLSIKGGDEMDPDIESLRNIHALLDAVERDIVPLTCTAVCQEGGNTSAGAAVLLEEDYSLILATTNQEALCPLYHAAALVVMEYCEGLHSKRISNVRSSECVVVVTHRPCRTCRHTLLRAGFNRVYYLFEDSGLSCGDMTNYCCSRQPTEGKEEVKECPSCAASVDYSERFTSTSKLIDDISNKRKAKPPVPEKSDILSLYNASQAEHSSGVPVSALTARGMAVAAAVSREAATARRRIEQLKRVYTRIDEQRLAPQPTHSS